ncbi:unnamed protein product [Musa textilis]
MKRDFSDFDLQALAEEKGEATSHGLNQELSSGGLENVSENADDITPEVMIQSGHVSDPGMGRTTAFWGSPIGLPFLQNLLLSIELVLGFIISMTVHSARSRTMRTKMMKQQQGSQTHPIFLETGESSSKTSSRNGQRRAEEVSQANNVIQSLNSLSSVAHIASMGLKVIPSVSVFTSLRSVNLSGNLIVHISPGCLPRSLHMLDLSRNKIATIEGLRELTRLRVLNLSYNRISRIGHGLSNCTVIKQLYLAGNKISGVEGLHRLLKLTVLDLSFNKITTAKALGQLVANYSSLLALNLLGNPIQSNIGDDQLRKAVCGLLPHVTFLNKQPIKPLRAREAATDRRCQGCPRKQWLGDTEEGDQASWPCLNWFS